MLTTAIFLLSIVYVQSPVSESDVKREVAPLLGKIRFAKPIPGGSAWAVFSYEKDVALVKKESGKWKLLSSTPLPYHSGGMEKPNGPDFHLHTNRNEVVISGEYGIMAGDWPSAADVYTVSKGRLSYVGCVLSNDQVRVTDLDHDGHFELINAYEIGWTLSHAEQPRWQDIHRVRRGKLMKANAQFPSQYKGWPQDLWDLLTEHPLDGDLWAFYGDACRLTKHPIEPKMAYDRMLRYLKTKKPNDLSMGSPHNGSRALPFAISKLGKMSKSNGWPKKYHPIFMVK